jgi:16S rRNA processing protein RimM
LTEKGEKKFDVVITGEIKNGLSARMSGVISKEEADKLKGTRLYVPRERLPQLLEDEYYHTDLIGLIVQNLEGSNIGRIKSVLNHGASDLLEIEDKRENKSILVPFTQQIVPKVDIKNSIVIIDPPKGLF